MNAPLKVKPAATGAENMASARKPAPRRTPPRLLTVTRTVQLSPRLQRVTLGGEALTGFPANRNGAHIKVFIPRPGQSEPVLPTLGESGVIWPAADVRPITRTYSVRRFNTKTRELEVDFVLHGDTSPASGWATRAKAGDKIGIAGPGGPDPLLAPADWQMLVGDITAVPAISAIAEQLPAEAKGEIFIHLEHYSDCLGLSTPRGFKVNWVICETPDAPARLLEAVGRVTPADNLSKAAFVAGENASVLAVRDYLRQRFGLRKANLYAVPYWRYGQDEETYHQERHRVMDEEY